MAESERTTWEEDRRLVLSELERITRDIGFINEKIERVRQEDLAKIKLDLALLKFQSALYGSIAGVVFSGFVTFLFRLLK
jgi:hypothetical protein